MICTSCFAAENQPGKTELTITINDAVHTLRDLDCDICPACGEITFTHLQSLEIDKKRITLEFGAKPLLTPLQLKTLRQVLNLKLEEICDLLHVGRNSYGRWERGEVAITPSMNLLVHQLIDRFPDAQVNLFAGARGAAIAKVNATLLGQYLSFGEYLREVLTATHLLPEVVCAAVGLEAATLVRLENNDLPPEQTPPDVMARLACFLGLDVAALRALLSGAARDKKHGAVREKSGEYGIEEKEWWEKVAGLMGAE
ncbi:MAG: type II toxin-antitoxin system MqsA family antitoxin [Desulfuromonadales bacterium]|nr:type II toxin-antitoxin system MqsA family antitoxin [Desulfuromonadales bacterium]